MVINWSDSDVLQFKMREPQMCNVVCNLKLDAKAAKEFKEKINDEYRVNMYVMPGFDISFSAIFLPQSWYVVSYNGSAFYAQDPR